HGSLGHGSLGHGSLGHGSLGHKKAVPSGITGGTAF
ncbi:hypothetical protein HMPREF1207_01017, partial [Paenibacillus sp. HGH0039]